MKKWMCWLIIFSLILVLGLITGCERKSNNQVIQKDDKLGAPTRPPEDYKQWDAPPEMMIDVSKIYLATVKTGIGDIKFELMPSAVPVTVNNFIFLAREGFYDGLTFHRVIPDFVIQGGCPNGNGMGGPGYSIDCELDGGNQYHDRGVLSMAHAGRNTGGSQFFICHSRRNTSHLDRQHTCFGKVVEGLDVIDSIRQGDRIEKITISED